MAEGEMRVPKCPRCRSTKNVIPIIYGMPGSELFEQAERGEVKLGGCVVFPDQPDYHCRSCGGIRFQQDPTEPTRWTDRAD